MFKWLDLLATFNNRWNRKKASSFQLLELENLLRWSFFTFIYNRSSNVNYFIYTSQCQTLFASVQNTWLKDVVNTCMNAFSHIFKSLLFQIFFSQNVCFDTAILWLQNFACMNFCHSKILLEPNVKFLPIFGLTDIRGFSKFQRAKFDKMCLHYQGSTFAVVQLSETANNL